MQLDEALNEIADCRKRLAQITSRLPNVARYQEGEEPAENAGDLLAEARGLIDRIEELNHHINLTNSRTYVAAGEGDTGRTITELLARRDALGARVRVLNETADAATGESSSRGFGYGRRMRSELTERTDLDVPALRREASQMAQERRQLDLLIQRAGQTTELV
jgi:hypothetical protein